MILTAALPAPKIGFQVALCDAYPVNLTRTIVSRILAVCHVFSILSLSFIRRREETQGDLSLMKGRRWDDASVLKECLIQLFIHGNK
jgi:hypothetical protein